MLRVVPVSRAPQARRWRSPTASTTTAPPTLARDRATTRPSLRCSASWITKVSRIGAGHHDRQPGEGGVRGEDADQHRAHDGGEPDRYDAPQLPGHKAMLRLRTLTDRRFGGHRVAQLLILTSRPTDPTSCRRSALLSHRVRVIPAEPALARQRADLRPDLRRRAPRPREREVAVQDPQHDRASTCRSCSCSPRAVSPRSRPTGASTTSSSSTAGPAEVDARIRLVIDRLAKGSSSSKIQASGVVIDEASYSAKVHGRPLDLTFKEFELLRFLATHPSRVFTREQLLSEVWGYDYFGGTRTVDVHVRRLRAKLGDLESLIGTVRNVGLPLQRVRRRRGRPAVRPSRYAPHRRWHRMAWRWRPRARSATPHRRRPARRRRGRAGSHR